MLTHMLLSCCYQQISMEHTSELTLVPLRRQSHHSKLSRHRQKLHLQAILQLAPAMLQAYKLLRRVRMSLVLQTKTGLCKPWYHLPHIKLEFGQLASRAFLPTAGGGTVALADACTVVMQSSGRR
jgi:hypothetical protein